MAETLAFDPEVTIDGRTFRLWKDGDLEIDLSGDHSDWRGHYFKPEDAKKLRDWLNKVLPDG